HPEEPEHRLVPSNRADVEEEGARGIGGVGRVDAAPGEVPQEPRVDGAEGQLAAPGALARPGHRVEYPADLRPGEVGIEHEPRARPDRRLDPVRPEPLAELGGTPALPHDGRVDGTTRGPIPDDRRLPLVRDPDRGDPASGGVAP